MRFKKFGKALGMGALSAGAIFGIASCVESYSVGYLYVTGTQTVQSGDNGVISGFKIDHNTGKLSAIAGLPVGSGGSNPIRAVLTVGSRFVYVLNRGVNAEGNGNCTPAEPCKNSNITQFVVGGNGLLTAQSPPYFTQGVNPFRLTADGSGSYLFVLDHDAPDSGVTTMVNGVATNSCTLALGPSNTTCADITVLKIDQTSGRLSVVPNQAITSQYCPTSAINCPLTYFPVPANPVDFAFSSGYILTLTGAPAPVTSFPYTGGTSVWPYVYTPSTGQLTASQNGIQVLGIHQGTAIVSQLGVTYVLDNEPITVTFNLTSTTSASQILPFTIGGGGALQAEPSGAIPDDSTLANPVQLLVESKDKLVYVANQGNNTAGQVAGSGIAGYFITTVPSFQLSFVPGEPFGSGSGPQCIVEDPSDQFIYEANQYDSTVTGRALDPNSGYLSPLRVTQSYSLKGPATWCLVDGVTS